MKEDTFVFEVATIDKAFTKRGVLSVINSIFDPTGFLAPVTIKGKTILRSMMTHTTDWDEPLPESYMKEWESWKRSLFKLKNLQIPRCYSNLPLKQATCIELLTFCDASDLAIAATSYLVVHSVDKTYEISFVFGKAKVAPSSGHTIPRLELCAAVLAVHVASTVQAHIDIKIDHSRYYSDSKIVLGYIYNTSRRFAKYVSNRVATIHGSTSPRQWKYVPTKNNPADVATRGTDVDKLQDSLWFNGPPSSMILDNVQESQPGFPLINPQEDKEVKEEVNVVLTTTTTSLGSERFTRFSSWKRLMTAVALLIMIARKTKGDLQGVLDSRNAAELLILKECQRVSYSEEFKCLSKGERLPQKSSISKLNPYIDESGLIRVGGRLNNSGLQSNEKNPVILPRKHHISTLIVRHFHEKVIHQGRHFTEGAVRSSGFWIVGSKRLVTNTIRGCVFCKRYRGKFEQQKMSDLPHDRINESPPFTYVGVDMFGPWQVTTRKTRRIQTNNKRWAILFTCLSVRAIHIEVVEDMSASSFLNALRRFLAIRGTVKQFRSDRGTNFVGATENANITAVNVEDKAVKQFLLDSETTWEFNTPHSSHMGGAWERMIGLVRRILDNMLVNIDNLTHEVLVTLMAEVAAIVNSRPLVPVSYDNEVPEILTPNALLTQKMCVDAQPLNVLNTKEMYKAQWLRVRHLADVFWTRWRRDYLHNLQCRQKWTEKTPNIVEGDVVIVRDHEVGRMDWPLGRVLETYPSDDGLVRKVKLRICKKGKLSELVRPIVEIVLLVSSCD